MKNNYKIITNEKKLKNLSDSYLGGLNLEKLEDKNLFKKFLLFFIISVLSFYLYEFFLINYIDNFITKNITSSNIKIFISFVFKFCFPFYLIIYIFHKIFDKKIKRTYLKNKITNLEFYLISEYQFQKKDSKIFNWITKISNFCYNQIERIRKFYCFIHDDDIFRNLTNIFKFIIVIVSIIFGIEFFSTENINTFISTIFSFEQKSSLFVIAIFILYIVVTFNNSRSSKLKKNKIFIKRKKWINNYKKTKFILSKILIYNKKNKKFKLKKIYSDEIKHLKKFPKFRFVKKTEEKTIEITMNIEHLKLYLFECENNKELRNKKNIKTNKNKQEKKTKHNKKNIEITIYIKNLKLYFFKHKNNTKINKQKYKGHKNKQYKTFDEKYIDFIKKSNILKKSDEIILNELGLNYYYDKKNITIEIKI